MAEDQQRAAEDEQIARQAMGSLLAASPRFDASPGVLAVMREGRVDVRVLAVLSLLATEHAVVAADMPVAAGDGPTTPRHSVVLSRMDHRPAASPETAAAVGRWLENAWDGPFAPPEVTPGPSGLAIDWGSAAPPGR
jgi:hypothetical protein